MRYAPSIRERLAIGFGLMLGLVLLMLGLSFKKLYDLDVKEHYADQVIAGRADEAVNIETAFLGESIALHSYIATRGQDYLKTFQAARQTRQAAIERLGNLPHTPEEKNLFDRLGKLAKDFEALSRQSLSLVDRGGDSGEVGELENRLRAVRTDLIQTTYQYALLQREKRIGAAYEVEAIRTSLLRLLCLLSVIILALSLPVVWLTIQAVRRPARVLVEAIGAMEAGDYRPAQELARVFPHGDPRLRNELHIVAGAFGRMAEVIRNRNEILQVQGEQLQCQSEELQAQYEEIQAQNEELQATLKSLQETEQALRRQAAALAEADRRKDEFLAMLAHELRNPLAAISNANYVLERGAASAEKTQQMRGMIARQLRHLSRLIDDLLDVSRITRGKVVLRKESVDLVRIVQNAVDAGQEMATRAGQTVTVAAPEAGITVAADPTRLEQMISNLLNNAIKYTEAGGEIRIEFGRENGWAVVRVRDSGIGIAPELLPHVFELFAQAESGPDRAKGGLGIGLTMVRSLAEMHGGSVEARSAGLGQGSEFIVRLPIGGFEI